MEPAAEEAQLPAEAAGARSGGRHTEASKKLDLLRERHSKVLEKLKRPNKSSTGGSSPASSGYATPVPGFGARAQDSALGKALRGSGESTQAIYSQVTRATEDLRNELWQGTAELQAGVQGHEAAWNQLVEARRQSGLRPEKAEELITRVNDISSEDMSVLLAAARAKLEAEEEAHAAAGQETRAALAELHGRMQSISSDRFDVKQQTSKMTQATSPTRRRFATLASEVVAIKAVVESRGITGPEAQELAMQLAACFATPAPSAESSPEASPRHRQLNREVSGLNSQWQTQAGTLRDWQLEAAKAPPVDASLLDEDRSRLQSLLAQGRAQLATLQRQRSELAQAAAKSNITPARHGELKQQLDEIKVKITSQQEAHESELASLRAERDMLHEELTKASRRPQSQKDAETDNAPTKGRLSGYGMCAWWAAVLLLVAAVGFVASRGVGVMPSFRTATFVSVSPSLLRPSVRCTPPSKGLREVAPLRAAKEAQLPTPGALTLLAGCFVVALPRRRSRWSERVYYMRCK